MAAVTANVSAQAQSEVSEERWRTTIDEKTREAEAKLRFIHEKWRTAVERAVAEDMFEDLLQLKGGWEIAKLSAWRVCSQRTYHRSQYFGLFLIISRIVI